MNKKHILSVLGIACVGAVIRISQLGEQIIGDDEWHAVEIALKFPLTHVLTHFHDADNCIPLTVFYKFLLFTTGLGEFGIHLPVLVAGILSILLLPVMLRTIVGTRASLIFATLVSLSPFLIYFSRYARPYGIVFLLSCISTVSFCFWIENKKKTYAAVYILCTALTSYFHILSFPALVAPCLFTFLLALAQRIWGFEVRDVRLPKLKELMIIGLLVAVTIGIWFLPTVGSLEPITRKVGSEPIVLQTMTGALTLLSGSQSIIISLLAVVLFGFGLYLVHRQNAFLFAILLSALLLQSAVIILLSPEDIARPLVLARYLISLLWIYFLGISVGLGSLGERLCSALDKRYSSAVQFLLITVSLVALTCSGPLLSVYGRTNSFSSHDDFQGAYQADGLDIDVSYRKNLPKFYLDLISDPGDAAIIEAPFVWWWAGNMHHFYQRFHGKRILVGHPKETYLIPGMIMSERLKLRNYVNLEDLDELRNAGAKYAVIHRDIVVENAYVRHIYENGTPEGFRVSEGRTPFFEERYGRGTRAYTKNLIEVYKRLFGVPHYQDRWIAVFKLPSRKHGPH